LKLVSSSDETVPRQGQTAKLKFKSDYEVSVKKLSAPNKSAKRTLEEMRLKHSHLLDKNDWRVPHLQDLYDLEQLSLLSSEDQLTLYNLIRTEPEILLFQSFAGLSPLDYETYAPLSKEPVDYGLYCEAWNLVDRFQELYDQNVAIPADDLRYATGPVLRLLKKVGVEVVQDQVQWQYSVRLDESFLYHVKVACGIPCIFPPKLRLANTRLEEIVFEAICRSQTVFFNTGLTATVQEELFGIFSEVQYYDFLNFGEFHRHETLENELLLCTSALLYNAHLASPTTLLGILQNFLENKNSLVFIYDRNYPSPTARLLNSLECTVALYEDVVPCLSAPEHYLSMQEFFPALAASPNAVLVTDTEYSAAILQSEYGRGCAGQAVMQRYDQFCCVMPFVQVEAVFMTHIATHQGKELHFCMSELRPASVLRLGQLRRSYAQVFYYSTHHITAETRYVLQSHAEQGVYICSVI